MNIISCTINNNQASDVSTRANFEQRAHHNAPMAFLIWKPMLCYPIWQYGGGVYIEGSSTIVTITLTSIYQNTARYVSFLPVLNQGPTTTPR